MKVKHSHFYGGAVNLHIFNKVFFSVFRKGRFSVLCSITYLFFIYNLIEVRKKSVVNLLNYEKTLNVDTIGEGRTKPRTFYTKTLCLTVLIS